MSSQLVLPYLQSKAEPRIIGACWYLYKHAHTEPHKRFGKKPRGGRCELDRLIRIFQKMQYLKIMQCKIYKYFYLKHILNTKLNTRYPKIRIRSRAPSSCYGAISEISFHFISCIMHF